MNDPPHSDPRADLEAKTAFLLSPGSYPGFAGTVELVETHMARVFLTDRYAYKMKKAVRTDYLDFSTLALREHACREELRLNRRLTSEVYLAVVPLSLGSDGRLRLGDHDDEGNGEVVEWLVKMRRLPLETCLTECIAEVSAAELAPLLRHLCDFYRAAQPLAVDPVAYLRGLQQQVEHHRQQLLAPGLGLEQAGIHAVADFLLAVTRREAGLLGQRAVDGRIVEGHGDLRPEHCFLTEPPQVIDCLEFNFALRCVDPLDELGYLALECELLGRRDLGDDILSAYRRACADPAPALLEYFYKAYRALVRAQLAAAHLQDGAIAEPQKWRAKARRYLDAARHYGRRADAHAA
ncbi:Aminoglycoside phosphotransferase family enzyme [Microbulbifer yueqingensis]|uniref:Aminoglycoside phosphotransferase family enzyme n=2 Tax=Microbulbifer yueqingensis TaxID=658219 RepID=A0A1G9BZ03_9GAMM|nr:Aminoglycoside phosphotransferase family enzyme [Microbulbifer yueqingensis]